MSIFDDHEEVRRAAEAYLRAFGRGAGRYLADQILHAKHLNDELSVRAWRDIARQVGELLRSKGQVLVEDQ